MLDRLMAYAGGMLMCLGAGFSSAHAQTSPVVVSYQFNEKAAPVGLRALVNIEELMADCVQDLALGTIDKLAFLGASLRVEGFRVKTQSGEYLYMNMDSRVYERLPPVDAGWISRSLKEGRRVAVAYQQCGVSGRLYSARDIYFR